MNRVTKGVAPKSNVKVITPSPIGDNAIDTLEANTSDSSDADTDATDGIEHFVLKLNWNAQSGTTTDKAGKVSHYSLINEGDKKFLLNHKASVAGKLKAGCELSIVFTPKGTQFEKNVGGVPTIGFSTADRYWLENYRDAQSAGRLRIQALREEVELSRMAVEVED